MPDEQQSADFDCTSLRLRLDLAIPANVHAITPVVEKIMKFAGEMECLRGKEFEVEISLREALANAIVHGARNDPSRKVEICVACDESHGMLIVVRDPGNGFDPKSLPDPLHGENVYSAHGRGIYLINQLMDEVRFEKGGTEIHMRKY
jgi:serine/threonine-protein kinase RsbW